MVNSWDKFRLLLWKNWTLQKRHKIQTAVEIVVPVLFITLLVLVRSLVEPEWMEPLHFRQFSSSDAGWINSQLLPDLFGNESFIDLPDPIKNEFSSNFLDLLREDSSFDLPDSVQDSICGNFTIPYSPSTATAQDVVLNAMVDLVIENLQIYNASFIPNPEDISALLQSCLVGFPNSTSLFSHLSSPLYDSDSSICGIALDDSLADLEGSPLPDKINITLYFPAELRRADRKSGHLNWYTDFAFTVFPVSGPRTPTAFRGGLPGYADEGFSVIAHGLLRRFTMNKGLEELPEIVMQRFPHPRYLRDPFVVTLKMFLPLMLMLSFAYTCINIVKAISTEKELQLKEVMKVMGLDNWLHWLAWFIKSFSYIFITIILIVILLKVEWYRTWDGTMSYSIFTHTPWHVVLFFLLIYTTTTICFCFMISVFFSKANTAATVAGLVWFLSFAPYTFLSNGRTLAPFVSRLLSCLASNTAMSFGFYIILNHETSASGLHWSRFWTVITEDDPLVMGHILVMLVADAFIYLLIALYVEQVMPGSYGVPQPWYFPFTLSFWTNMHSGSVGGMETPCDDNDSHNIEADPRNVNVGVHILNLTKIYNGNVAVDNLNLKIFEGQITVILGHNGAGKTTTMSMLSGMITPSAGTAFVAGHNIRSDIRGARSSLGLCPQHNVLFTDLTVSEHIYFFARLKGIQGEALKQQVHKYVRLLGLKDKRNVVSTALSGGMKRRLSVGVALCGGSKVVLLDEPSSGIDPASRRELWELLNADKKDRTIILSTHFMDEAEVLGERVAVMAGGKVRAVGSPFFLKRKFSVGYTLTAATATSASAAEPLVTDLIKSHIPNATLYSSIGSELSYHLPSEFSNKFEPLLRELETRNIDYGLNSFGISAGSLEDVFMKVGADDIATLNEDDQTAVHNESNGVMNGDAGIANTFIDNPSLAEKGKISDIRFTGMRLWMDQWYAMFYKRMVSTLRTWMSALLQLLLPVMFLVIAILVDRVYESSEVLPARELTLSNGYQDSETIISYSGPLDDVTRSRMTMYTKYFEGHPTMKVVNIGDRDMEEYYLNKSLTDMSVMRKRNMAGATFSSDKIVVWFSNFAFHDLPASLMLVYNAIVKAISPNNSYSLTNHPLPYTMDTKISQLALIDSQGFQLAFNIGFSFAFVSGFYILFYIKENVTKSKLLQLASGVSPFILWTSALLWDLFCFVLISVALAITLLAFQQDTFTTAVQIFRLLLLLLIFGFSMLPFHYLVSAIFITPATGFSRMVFFNLFTGVATFLIVQMLAFPGIALVHVSDVLHWIFMVFPHYAISNAIKNHYVGYIRIKYCYMVCDTLPVSSNATCNSLQSVCDIANTNPGFSILEICCMPEDPYFIWKTPGILPHIMYMIGCGVVFFSILLLKEYKLIDVVMQKLLRPKITQQSEEEDSDVAAERHRVNSMDEKEYHNHSLLCKNMSKRYDKNLVAVNNLSFGVEQGECFGLLGMNGAGKTTTFKMLMGDLYMSSGGAWVNGRSVNNDMKTVYNHIGYCPQFDALLDEMTGRETLEMFARLKGIPPAEKERYVWSLSRKLGFSKHLDKKVREYSGGNKRKLSTAVALLGDPEVVYLDEPTTGMDPVAKRRVWRAVANRQVGCVVLTSHSMEECEALCTRLAIMVNGSFRCLGSTQHLKNKFSQGYTLIVKLRRHSSEGTDTLSSPSRQSLQHFLDTHFPGAQLKEAYQGLMTYFLPFNTTTPWSRIFGLLEEAKNTLDLEDYSVGQTSLEQIFLQFTSEQTSTSL